LCDAERAYVLWEALALYDMAAVQSENSIQVGALLLGKYRVLRELGRGGMASVYEAEHVHIGKRLAVKVLASELASSTIVIERFFREARAAAAVKSPYIVDVHDSGRLEDGRPFIAMELLVGESLYDRMARVRLIDPRTTVRIVSQVAKGLTKAHAAGIVHRDLKPENIHLCVGEDGEEIAKILDFGLAKFYSPVQTDEKTARLTREGAVFGTPAYMSPEQVKGQGTVDHRADLWALGCMAFECLTGRPVWNTEQGVAMTFAAIAAAPLPIPSRLRTDLSLEFDFWFEKALDRDPDRRFQSAKELAEALAKALGAAPPPSLTSFGSPSHIEFEALSVDGSPDVDGSPRSSPSAIDRLPPRSPRALSEPLETVVVDASADERDFDGSRSAPTAVPPRRRARSRGRWIWSGLLLGMVGAGAGAGWWFRVIHRAAHPAAVRTASAVSVELSPPSVVAPPPASAAETPSWLTVTEEGQQLLSSGDADGALRKFHDAIDAGAGALGKSFFDQVKLGSAATGPCKMVAFSHPRLGFSGPAGRPAVAVTPLGAIVAWTDDHEQPGHDHAYSVLIDASGRPTSRPRDLTPEADYVVRPALLPAGDRAVLLYWDKNARDPGVRVRWLDADGRIGMMSEVVAAAKPGLTWPAPVMEAADGGGFWVAWQQDTDKDGEDLFLRRLGRDLKPIGLEIRLTDFESDKGRVPRAGSPSVAASADSVFVAYAVDRDHQHAIERMRIQRASSDFDGGLQSLAKAGRATRELGEVTSINEPKVNGDYPAIACAGDGCFVVWHELDKGGAEAAFLDPVGGALLWRKRFAPHGGHPAIAAAASGRVAVAYYEAGRVRVASVTRDGVGVPSVLARVSGDPPRPWIGPGRVPGEWYVAWLDAEAGHSEPLVARVQCRD
jgi:serine/threonine-protein kinase